MKTHANATFAVKNWDEKPYNEIAGMPKLTRASVSKVFHGDFEGEGTVEYLMMYRPDNSANFVGLERMVGKMGNFSGSFVLQHSGTDDGKMTKATWFVVPGSGTGDLRGLRGEGAFVATHAQPNYSFTLDYDFEKSPVTNLKSLVPPFAEPTLIGVWFLLRPFVRVLFFGRQHYCPVCRSHCRVFLAHGARAKGRPDVVCPVCLCHDRHRLAYVFLRASTNLFDGLPKRLLHFAPEPEFMRQFRRTPRLGYVSADWASPHAGLKIDIRNNQLADCSFDAVYCSHVLEHVREDRQAIREIFRVLAPGGWAVVQVPMGEQPQTIEFPVAPSDRAGPSWSTKHVRRYGTDFPERLREGGFQVQTISAQQVANPQDCRKMGLIDFEPLFYCTKPG